MDRRERSSADLDLSDNGRLLSLSDGVFAFAMTLLVLGLQIPKSSEVSVAQLPDYVLHQLPGFFVWVLSFMVIGMFWMGHHRLFDALRFHDDRVALLNLLALLAITFIPFPTSLVGDYSASRFATILYSCSLLVASGLITLIQLYVWRNRQFLQDQVTPDKLRLGMLRSGAVQAVGLLSIGVALVNPGAALWCWILILPAHQLLDRFAS